MSENKITDKKIKNSIDEFYTLYENAKQKGFLESKNFINSKPFSQTSEYVPQKEKFYERFERQHSKNKSF